MLSACLHICACLFTCDGLQVHDSLKKSGKLSPETMAFFDHEESANVLYHMRFLPVSARPAVAEYIVDRQLDAAVCPTLLPCALTPYTSALV